MVQTKKLLVGLTTAALLFGAPIAFAQTASTTTTGTASSTTSGTTGTGGTGATTNTSSTPGAPNTGAGGDADTNLLLLGISGVVVVAVGAYLARRAVVK